jgi:anti-sigma factor RsiW
MQTHERIQEIVDGEIGPGRAEKILEKHLEACRSCNSEADAIRELKDAIARVGGKADPDLVASLEVLARRLCDGYEA